MAARFGHVLGWAGDIVGGLLMLMGAYFGAVGTTGKVTQFLFLFAPGFAIFLIGRACRYVLAGEQEKEKMKRLIHNNELIILVAILAAFVGWQLNKGFTMAAIF
jgi:4-hydroxybenzoate polyprenyltransferase